MALPEDLDRLMFPEGERPLYYRRDGTPYKNILEYAKDFEETAKKPGSRHVAQTTLWWGGRVSTVWLGLDHSYFDGPPLIFETMVFPRSGFSELDMDRYSTEAQAADGHRAMVRKWSNPFRGLRALMYMWYYAIIGSHWRC